MKRGGESVHLLSLHLHTEREMKTDATMFLTLSKRDTNVALASFVILSTGRIASMDV